MPQKKQQQEQTTYTDKVLIGISYLLRILILIEAGTALWEKNFWLAFLAFFILLLTFGPSLIQRNYRINLPLELESLVVIFISFSLFLGELRDYYTIYWWWDILLHSISSIVLAFVGFLILYVLYTEKKIAAKPVTIMLFSFCFAVAIGALWEILEFSLDSIVGLNMQKSGLQDTMLDLIVDSVSAFVVSLAGFFYIKGKRSGLFFRPVVERFVAANPTMFRKRKL
jgi:hypothetical protein